MRERIPKMDQPEQSALESAFKAQEESLYEVKTQNRIMRKALVEIMGIRFWNVSADYSPKKVAERALRECERV